MTEMQSGQGPIEDVHEGMKVVDADGEELGTVAEMKMGDAAAVTSAGQQGPRQDDLISTFARGIWDGSDVPEQAAERLIRLGYVRVDVKMAPDRYAAADLIERVDGDVVHLNVGKDALARSR